MISRSLIWGTINPELTAPTEFLVPSDSSDPPRTRSKAASILREDPVTERPTCLARSSREFSPRQVSEDRPKSASAPP